MVIDWAVFGERNRGHTLLAASGSEAFATRITQYTDRPGDPPPGLGWGPVNSGFFFAEHYVLLRTLPDPSAGRAGMVRSYAAFVPAAELGSLGNLTAVFSKLPQTLLKPVSSLEPLSIAESDFTLKAHTGVPGLTAIARRLGSPKPVLPLVWSSDEPYLPAVDALWGRLPASLRREFAFAFQFAPEHNLPTMPTVVATLGPLAGRWPAEQLIRLEVDDKGKLNTAQTWFAGVSQGAAFNDVLADFGIAAKEFSELSLLSQFVDLIDRLPELTFSETLKAVRIVEKYSKSNAAAANGRDKLFARLCALVSIATPKEIAMLRNLNSAVLRDLIAPLQAAIQQWLRDNPSSEGNVSNLEFAADAPNTWWSQSFAAWLRTLTTMSSVADAQAVCTLLASEKTSSLIDTHLTGEVGTEDKLLNGLPDRLSSEHVKNILRLAQDRDWMRLHAACLLRSRGKTDAIIDHAKVAGNTTGGFSLLREQLGFSMMLQTACASGDENLVAFVGATLESNIASVPHEIASKCAHWYLILGHAIHQSRDRLVEPLRSLVIATLEHASGTEAGFLELCSTCTYRDPTLWLELMEPANVLERLSPDLVAAAIAKINEHLTVEIKAARRIKFANADAFREIVDGETILQSLTSVPPTEAAKAGINAFRSIPFLSDADCCRWLIDLFTRTHHIHLPTEMAHEIASVLLAANYPKAAGIVRETVENFNRRDVAPVLDEIRYKYQMTADHGQKQESKNVRLPKVVIATALPLERNEVVKWLGATEYDAELFADLAKWPAEHPVFEIYVLATGAGNLEAQGAILRLLQRMKPKFAFFVGVAGGVKDSEVGDVIYSTKVHYYEGGKEEDDEIKSRPVSESSSEAMIQLAHRVAERQWQPLGQTGMSRAPKASPAIIASGEKVMASTLPKAKTFKRIKTSFNDTQVVDMEAFGFLKACRDQDVRHSMVIRGISDKVAGKTESDAKGSQPVAAQNAAAFLFALLEASQDILKPKKKRRFLRLFGL